MLKLTIYVELRSRKVLCSCNKNPAHIVKSYSRWLHQVGQPSKFHSSCESHWYTLHKYRPVRAPEAIEALRSGHIAVKQPRDSKELYQYLNFIIVPSAYYIYNGVPHASRTSCGASQRRAVTVILFECPKGDATSPTLCLVGAVSLPVLFPFSYHSCPVQSSHSGFCKSS